MTAAALEIAGLSAGYGPTRVIDGLDLSVAAGARLAVLGRNGVGKTTLLATLMGRTTQRSGSIRLDTHELGGLRPSARAALGLGYVPQTRDIFGSLTVEENLATGLKGRSRAALAEAYALFPRLAERRRNAGHQLSGGEQQMLSLARTLLGQPRVLLLDEPLEGLAPVICDELMEAITGLALSGETTILLVEQQIGRALAFAERAIVIERGRIAWAGASTDLAAASGTVDQLLGVGVR
ncbi:ABC transporter ATP-binding protein [Methylobacterium currus]|uniref:ABC transporter ATP-binding protein n=1 Tax=Methylobacterium currus TaxID=2051553 RepID=A0A2R4WVS7_9HYPH|nr:ABC transporter ATP-binding protein [Methylobacterium currus]AWB25658.1 ABC transporter ATP-binding protein [Methylobacterium currus]UHC19365.1 ABC transporter ATP-binding protein [Methylobacterium currus]